MSQIPKPWEVENPHEKPVVPEEDVVIPDAILLTDDKMITLGDGTEVQGTSVVHNADCTRRERYLRLVEMEKSFDRPYVARMKSFVVEYSKDFVASKAIARMYPDKPPKYCVSKGTQYLNLGYVQLLLSLYLDEINEEAIVTRKDVLAGLLREANETGAGTSQSARVAAWKAIGKILGMEIDRSVSMNVGVNVPAPIDAKAQKAFLEKLHAEF